MKPLHALCAIMLAFPLLYVTGAVLRGEGLSTVALLWTAAVCTLMLRPQRK
ncbi:MAG: hypothetical protein M3Q29_05990 [Chloroflexota bacterium]|nr:hypothetical protein [Chloroflexota bacterium]